MKDSFLENLVSKGESLDELTLMQIKQKSPRKFESLYRASLDTKRSQLSSDDRKNDRINEALSKIRAFEKRNSSNNNNLNLNVINVNQNKK